MGASTLDLQQIVNPEVMESIACKEGMTLASTDSFRLVIV